MNDKMSRKAIVISVSGATILAMLVLTISVNGILMQSSASEMSRSIDLTGEKVSSGFFFGICGDNGISNARGTAENPISVKRDDKPVALEFCARSTDNSPKSWELSAVDVHNLSEPPTGGIGVAFEKKSVDMPSYAGDIRDFSAGKGHTDNFKAYISADSNSPIGQQGFMIKARYLTQDGYYQVVAQAVYIHVN